MPRLNNDTALIAAELEHLVADWCYELDINHCDVTKLCTEDCDYYVGGKLNKGHAAIKAFYDARNERVRTQQRDGVRTQRHTVSNFRCKFHSATKAEVFFTLVNYSAEGKAPALNLVGPTIIADTRFECVLESDGEWRIALFDSAPTFVGNDPFLNAAVVKK